MPRSRCRTLHLALLSFMRCAWAQACQGPCGVPSLQHLSACVPSKCAQGALHPRSLSLTEGSDSISPQTDPWGAPLTTGFHLDIELLTTALGEWPSSQFLIHQLPTSPDCHDFSNRMDSGLATSSTGALRTHGCISSGSMELFVHLHIP